MFKSIQEEVESRGVEFGIDPVGASGYYWFMADMSDLPVGVTGEESYDTLEQAILAAAPHFGIATTGNPVVDPESTLE